MMLGKKKSAKNRYIIAVKDYNNTVSMLKEGLISLPKDTTVYLRLLESRAAKWTI